MRDDLGLVNAVASVADAEEEPGVAMALVHLFITNNKEAVLLRNFIRREVQQAGKKLVFV